MTVFPIGSYVLQKQEHPPTRLHTKWKGLLRVVSFVGSEYVLANLIAHKEHSVHVKNLKIFNYDPLMGMPADTARRDYMEYFVEKVLSHTGDKKKPTSMSFHLKWLNCDDSHKTWEPWGKISGSVKHSIYTWRMITCHVLSPRILSDQPSRYELERFIF